MTAAENAAATAKFLGADKLLSLDYVVIVTYFNDPECCMNNSLLKLRFLRAFGAFIHRWQQSGMAGLTPADTALACKQMAAVLPAAAEYLIEQRGFLYVLFGKINSDPLENRYVQYRQERGKLLHFHEE